VHPPNLIGDDGTRFDPTTFVVPSRRFVLGFRARLNHFPEVSCGETCDHGQPKGDGIDVRSPLPVRAKISPIGLARQITDEALADIVALGERKFFVAGKGVVDDQRDAHREGFHSGVHLRAGEQRADDDGVDPHERSGVVADELGLSARPVEFGGRTVLERMLEKTYDVVVAIGAAGCAIATFLAHSGSPNVPGLLDTGLQRERDLVSIFCVRRLPNLYSGVEQHAEVQTPMNL